MAFKRVLGGFVAAALLFLSTMIAVAEPYRIVGFGDSLMAGYGLDPGNGFTEKLQAALKARGIDAEVANGSVSGDTTSGGLSRLDWSVPDGTQLVLVELGANDMLRGVTPDITERSLDAILTRLKERKIAVLLVGMRAAPNLGAEYRAAFDRIYPKLAAKHGVTLYPFFLDGVAADPKYLQSDQMHPNAAGVDEIVKRFLPTLEKELAAGPDNS
jgi:acyl-CoA thioesterase-1